MSNFTDLSKRMKEADIIETIKQLKDKYPNEMEKILNSDEKTIEINF